MAAVFCVLFEARCKSGIVSPMCPPEAKGKYRGSKIPMLLDDDLAVMDNCSDYLWMTFLNKYEFIGYQRSCLHNNISAVVGDGFHISIKKWGYRLIYDLDLELSILARMHGGS